MLVGIPKEKAFNEARVAMTPEIVKKMCKKGFTFFIEHGCGESAGFSDSDYAALGVEIVDSKKVFSSKIILKINRPMIQEIALMQKGALLIALMEPYKKDGTLEKLAACGVDAVSLELIPRISRAQSMDVLSSQANIAGYRAVIEAASHFGRFFPLMMTSAGSVRAAKCVILGAGVAGLQCIATAKRLGGNVEAYDIRSEVKEQIRSLGAKVIEIECDEKGSTQGGYAKELSEEIKKKQQSFLQEKLKQADIIISTAAVPGKIAPILITEDAVKAMRRGSVIIDMSAGFGGNCALTKPHEVVTQYGVKIIGYTDYPSRIPADASHFFGNNISSLLGLFFHFENGVLTKRINLEDAIMDAVLVTYEGKNRFAFKEGV